MTKLAIAIVSLLLSGLALAQDSAPYYLVSYQVYQNDKLLVAPKLTLLSDREGTFTIGSDAEEIEVTTKISEVQGNKNTYRLVSSLVINEEKVVRIQQNIAAGNSFSFEGPKYKIIGKFNRSKS
ncbi:hypothetical protein [Vibrio aquimaris]|uniref:Uncharacterized protein n=1 Tax=Vibrio aquimaris TaxID=2587862 RepID=A0A5P9CIQ9_9VIBR|nr:hypothetical protein [Vibrio aquimaris]QFT26219.1 hypothetical protein FIV01_07245 [Vibrio aquimaris]